MRHRCHSKKWRRKKSLHIVHTKPQHKSNDKYTTITIIAEYITNISKFMLHLEELWNVTMDVILESQMQSYPILIRVDSIRLYPAWLASSDSSWPCAFESKDKLYCIQSTVVCTIRTIETDHLLDFVATAIEMMNYNLVFDMYLCINVYILLSHDSLSQTIYDILFHFVLYLHTASSRR